MTELTRTEIEQLDPEGMLHRILQFPRQLQHAQEISQKAEFKFSSENVSKVCITGMGGSAIGGDIVRCYALTNVSVPVLVSRYYALPASIQAKSFVIASSYSGNTEETLSAYEEACRSNANVACITSGGNLATEARSKGQPIFLVPSGFPPRSALGFMTVPLFYSLHYAGLLNSPDEELAETIELLDNLSQKY
ncbi:bifunctional phosphoglucose/phosphomannose isomerase, partial [candidate division KSB1 bacterium]|nr:bifunctional phosphoglucose/phosphomannose isomerase [candidate division KSB1 bacterium]NIR69498.1 bifunctional phosphoglucose/phosphomannose isomerase [candidate division KSB1 bacterium]NIS24266.1 bifunctional phosphoglucose/phosphomannose isomerase [candidate division KSB1 bacterium]NIT71181.1 bifunctional phosphoglucose/phosphomannose isomerase [candidate division KSB1 bacterium]NIU24885.1 bifunctional phosphoglucose/phosphomannose isomerase [candidate division KSB1 bacterium]